MRHEAIKIIKDEHFAISAVLYSLRFLVRHMRENPAGSDLRLLHAILDYIVSYPDRWHHPKENNFLFAAVRERTHAADKLIAELEREHSLGHTYIERLQELLLAFERDSSAAIPFIDAAERYAEIEWAHMRTEEDLLLPVAERVLTATDWERIAVAFQENDNPLFGLKPKDDADRLYQRILALAPTSIPYFKAP